MSDINNKESPKKANPFAQRPNQSQQSQRRVTINQVPSELRSSNQGLQPRGVASQSITPDNGGGMYRRQQTLSKNSNLAPTTPTYDELSAPRDRSKSSQPKETSNKENIDEGEEPLVSFNMNLSQLNEHLRKIIKVVNQHAKLIHTLNYEIQFRTTEKQVGELFNLIATGVPYQSMLKYNKNEPPKRRDSVAKILGGDQLVQSQLISDAIEIIQQDKESRTEQLQVSATEESKLSESLLSQQVLDIPLQTQSNEGENLQDELSTPQAQESILMSGTEKFLRATEMIGHMILNLKSYTKHNDQVITRVNNDIFQRLTSQEFNEYKNNQEQSVSKRFFELEHRFEQHINDLEKSQNEKLDLINEVQHRFEAQMHHKLKELDIQMEQRPSEIKIYKMIRTECEKTAKETREPIEKQIEELQEKVQRMDGEHFRLKTSTENRIDELRVVDEGLKKAIENEVVSTDKKVDHQRINFNRLIEDRLKKEEQIKKAINNLDRKHLALEKKVLEQPTSFNHGGGGMSMPPPLQPVSQPPPAPLLPESPIVKQGTQQLESASLFGNDKIEQFIEKNESMLGEVEKLITKVADLSDSFKDEQQLIRKLIASKADKETLIENQKQFFAQIESSNRKTDEHLSQVLSEEMRKLTEQAQIHSKVIDKKIAKLYQELDVEKMNKAIDKKMGREEADSRMEGNESKMVILDKCVLKVNTNLERLEVKSSFYNFKQSFVENLALAIRNLENTNLKGGINPSNISNYLRQSQMTAYQSQGSALLLQTERQAFDNILRGSMESVVLHNNPELAGANQVDNRNYPIQLDELRSSPMGRIRQDQISILNYSTQQAMNRQGNNSATNLTGMNRPMSRHSLNSKANRPMSSTSQVIHSGQHQMVIKSNLTRVNTGSANNPPIQQQRQIIPVAAGHYGEHIPIVAIQGVSSIKGSSSTRHQAQNNTSASQHLKNLIIEDKKRQNMEQQQQQSVMNNSFIRQSSNLMHGPPLNKLLNIKSNREKGMNNLLSGGPNTMVNETLQIKANLF